MKVYKIWRTYSLVYLVYSGHNLRGISNEACVYILQNSIRLLVKWRKLDHSIVVATISQWRLCLYHGLRWTFWAHYVVFSWFSVL